MNQESPYVDSITSKKIPLDEEAVMLCKEIMREQPIVKAATQDLLDDIFTHECVYFRGNVRIEPDPSLKSYIKTELIPCAKANLKSIFEIGLGMYVFVRNTSGVGPKKTVRYPSCRVDIQTYYDKKNAKRRFTATTEDLDDTVESSNFPPIDNASHNKTDPGDSGNSGSRSNKKNKTAKRKRARDPRPENPYGKDYDPDYSRSNPSASVFNDNHYRHASSDTESGDSDLEEEKHKIIVLSGFGCDPDEDGKLNSLSNTLINEYKTMKFMDEAYLNCIAKNSDKSLITEVPEDKPSIDERFMKGAYADVDPENKGGSEYYRSQNDARLVRYHVEGIPHENYGPVHNSAVGAQSRGKPLSANSGIRTTSGHRDASFGGVPYPSSLGSFLVPLPSRIQDLPPGHKLVNTPSATCPQDYVRLKEMFQEVCAAVFGSARNGILGSTSKTTAGVESVREYRTRSLSRMRLLAGDLLTHFYRVTHLKEELDVFYRSRDQGIDDSAADIPLGQFDTYNVKQFMKDESLRIVVPSSSPVNLTDPSADKFQITENMRELFESGVVTRAEFVNYSRAVMGLPPLKEESSGIDQKRGEEKNENKNKNKNKKRKKSKKDDNNNNQSNNGDDFQVKLNDQPSMADLRDITTEMLLAEIESRKSNNNGTEVRNTEGHSDAKKKNDEKESVKKKKKKDKSSENKSDSKNEKKKDKKKKENKGE